MFQHSSTSGRLFIAIAACALLTSLAFSQVAVPRPAPVRPAQPSANPAPHQQPCWQQAGISKTTIDQRRSIEQNAHAQVQTVCADPSLTMQQKREKIKEIRQEARQQIDAIISPEQQQEMKACNASRAANNPKPAPAPHPGAGTGPCGEVATSPAPTAGSSGGPEAPESASPAPQRP